jgi:hypothetical protein
MVELSFRFFPYYFSSVPLSEINHRSLGDLKGSISWKLTGKSTVPVDESVELFVVLSRSSNKRVLGNPYPQLKELA